MTPHDPVLHRPEQAAPVHFIAAARLVRPLAMLTVMTAVAAAVVFGLGRLRTSWFAASWPPSLAGLATGSLLLATLGLLSCLCMVLIRRRTMTSSVRPISQPRPNRIGDWQQTAVAVLLASAAAYTVCSDWPLHQPDLNGLAPSSGFTTASVLLLLCIPWLLADRYLATITRDSLPELADLRNLLFLPVFFLAAEAILQVAGSIGFGPFPWVRTGLASILLLIGIELSLRVFGLWFLPPRDNVVARAAIESVLAGLVHGRSLSPANVAGVIRSQFGMDFSRSWALRFIRSATLPVTLLMLAFCWLLTGVTRINMNERGAYERFGTVTEILQPGLHFVLPRPFGAVRHLEFGVMRSALINYGDGSPRPDISDGSTAEGSAPAIANRLWDSEQPSDVSYIIASREQNRESFQTVSVSVRVLYRTGLTDAAGRAVLYRIADQDALVHALCGRLLTQFFAAHTLPVLLGENQGVIGSDLRDKLQQALDGLGSGIEVVAVTIEAIHPPSGAASAYRNVQASVIDATTLIATEQGHAQTTKSVARMNAHNATDDAAAAAGETVSSAQVVLTGITADDGPYRAASQPFLLERYFNNIKAALANVPLEIVDHRLSGLSLPTIDLRPPGLSRDGADIRPPQRENTP